MPNASVAWMQRQLQVTLGDRSPAAIVGMRSVCCCTMLRRLTDTTAAAVCPSNAHCQRACLLSQLRCACLECVCHMISRSLGNSCNVSENTACTTFDQLILIWSRVIQCTLSAKCSSQSQVELAAGIGDHGLEPGLPETKLIIMNKLKVVANTKGMSADSKRWFSGHDAAQETLRAWTHKAFLADMTAVRHTSRSRDDVE